MPRVHRQSVCSDARHSAVKWQPKPNQPGGGEKRSRQRRWDETPRAVCLGIRVEPFSRSAGSETAFVCTTKYVAVGKRSAGAETIIRCFDIDNEIHQIFRYRNCV